MLRNTFKCAYTYHMQTTFINSKQYFSSLLQKPHFVKTNLKILNFQRNICVSLANRAKVHVDYENSFAYNIVHKDSFGVSGIEQVKTPTEVKTVKEFDNVLNQNWRSSSASEIVSAFKAVKNYCIQNEINVSDNRFDNLVDGLMDHCEQLTDTELLDLLQCLSELPSCDSATAHNFHDVWSCLDDICCWKILDWDLDKRFKFASIWYKLNLGKMGDYVFVLIDRLTKNADKLTKDQLVMVFFYFNVCRKRAVDFEYEYALQQKINEMNVDEMAVVSLGYFKTKTKIKLTSIMETMMERVKENSKTIHDISLAAIIKAIRFSKPLKVVPQMQAMLDVIYEDMDRLSNLCCLHIALIGTGVQSQHYKTMQKAAERIVRDITDIEKVRIKDIERLMNALTMFCLGPKTNPDFFKAAYTELHKKERLLEMIRYPRCLACALNYFSINDTYSYELMNKVLDVEYITEVYGKGAKNMPRELLSLDACIDIECRDYNGNRLPPQLRQKATKWVVETIPSHDQHKTISPAEKLFLDVVDSVKEIVKDDSCMKIAHIMPHFYRADIVVCREKTTGKFVPPCGFENYSLGDVMFPYKDESLRWYSISVLTWHNTIRDSNLPVGSLVMKKRQLRKMGYESIFVLWNEFMRLSKENKVDYIAAKLDNK